MTYSAAQTQRLMDELRQAQARGSALVDAFLLHPFANPSAQEYAHHGFVRRIHTLMRALARIFEALPPDIAEIQNGTRSSTPQLTSRPLSSTPSAASTTWPGPGLPSTV